MKKNKLILAFVILVLIGSGIFFFSKNRSQELPIQQTNMKLTSPAFADNQNIPSKYTCDGTSINPPLTISDVPTNAKSLALIVDDPDAPLGVWIHWVV